MKTLPFSGYFAVFLITSFIIISSISVTYATVGGPTYVGNFAYNPEDESVYFVIRSESGRGCPPELHKISLATGKTATVISCEQGESLGGSLSGASSAVEEEIAITTSGFKPLSSLSLPVNNIEVDVNFVRSESIDPQSDWMIRSHFVAQVYQNGRMIEELPLVGCSMNQPFTFAGYSIPGFEKKMILLTSAKGDCFEGGYISERLSVIDDITISDRSPRSNQYKTAHAPLVPDESTLVVYEKDTVRSEISVPPEQPANPSPTSPSEPKSPRTPLLVVTILSLGLGLLLGKIFFAKNI